jgi:hypothetical protein
MSYNLFLDDERLPPRNGKDWQIVRSFKEAVQFVLKHGMPGFVSFDHDLGDGEDGIAFAKWLIQQDLDGNHLPNDFDFTVHSENPVGAGNIAALLVRYLRFKKNTV